MSQVVHVIHPSGSPRWERTFPDSHTPERILAELREHGSKVLIGYVGTVLKTDAQTGFPNVPHPDRATGFVMDHPDTRVVLGRLVGDGFEEDRTIAGPAATQTRPDLKLAEVA